MPEAGQAWWEADLKDEKLRAKLRELDQLLRQQGAASEQVVNRGWAAGFDNAGRSLQKLGGNITRTGDSMTRNVTLPLVAAGGAAAKLALDFDTAGRQIVGLTDVTGAELDGIKEKILALGPAVGKGPQELIEAFYFIASAGFEADEAMDVLETSAKAAASGLGETQDIAKVLGGVINAYGKENITAARAADILTEAVSQGTAEANQFAGVLGNVVPGAAALGVTFDQVTAAMAGMTLSGVGVEESATSLIQIFAALQKPTAQAEEAMEDLGLSSAGLRKQLREEGLLATLRTLEERFAGNEVATAAVFGNIRALRGVTALLGLDTEQLNAVFEKVTDSQGRAATAYEETEGPARDLARSMADLQAVGIELGNDVLPIVVDVLKEIAGGARELAKWWRSLDDDTKRTVVQWAAAIAIGGPLLSILGKLISGIGGLFRGVGFLIGPKGLPALVGWLNGSYSASLKLLGPLGLLVGIAAGVSFGVGAMNEAIGGATGAFERLSQVAGGPEAARNAIKELEVQTGRSAESIILELDRLIAAGDDWKSALATMAGDASDSFGDSVDEARRWGGLLKGTATEVREGVVGEMANLPPEVVAVLEAAGVPIGTAADGTMGEVSEAAADARKASVGAMADMLDGMVNLFDSDETVHDAWQALIDRMDDPYTEAERKARLFSDSTIQHIRDALASGDPAIAADTATLVNNMLTQMELIEPGALASGTAAPPAIRAGMDAEMQALIDWVETHVTKEALSAMSLEEAREVGVEGIWSYNQGMLSNQRAAGTAASRIGITALTGLTIDASSGGASVVATWLAGMTRYYWANRRSTIDAIAADAGNIFGRSLPRSGPLKGGVGSGGWSIGESWIGGLVRSIGAGMDSVSAAVGGVGAMLSGSYVATAALGSASAGAASASAMTALAGAAGNAGPASVTTIHHEPHVHLHAEDRRPIIESPEDMTRNLQKAAYALSELGQRG